MNTIIPVRKDYRMSPDTVPETVSSHIGQKQRDDLIDRIRQLLIRENSVVVAHY